MTDSPRGDWAWGPKRRHRLLDCELLVSGVSMCLGVDSWYMKGLDGRDDWHEDADPTDAAFLAGTDPVNYSARRHIL